MKPSPQIHLVTYASAAFRHRQWFLGASARANRVVDTVTAWTPRKLLKAGFKERCPNIHLSERGSGFWAWKPFIIGKKLEQVPDGDIVFYCDAGRRFPYKQLTGSMQPFLDWMEEHQQDVMPGVLMPWNGPTSRWTKRQTFIDTGMDDPAIHNSTQIQASFSFWKNTSAAREFLALWLDWCSRRELIGDDPSTCDQPEFPNFEDHRYDQSLLTLCCLKMGIQGINIGPSRPVGADSQNPTDVARMISDAPAPKLTTTGRLIAGALRPMELMEKQVRVLLKPKVN